MPDYVSGFLGFLLYEALIVYRESHGTRRVQFPRPFWMHFLVVVIVGGISGYVAYVSELPHPMLAVYAGFSLPASFSVLSRTAYPSGRGGPQGTTVDTVDLTTEKPSVHWWSRLAKAFLSYLWT